MCFQDGEEKHQFFDHESLILENHPCTHISSGRIQPLNRRTRFSVSFLEASRLWFHEDCHHPPVPSTSDAYGYLKVLTHLCYVPVSEDKACSLIDATKTLETHKLCVPKKLKQNVNMDVGGCVLYLGNIRILCVSNLEGFKNFGIFNGNFQLIIILFSSGFNMGPTPMWRDIPWAKQPKQPEHLLPKKPCNSPWREEKPSPPKHLSGRFRFVNLRGCIYFDLDDWWAASSFRKEKRGVPFLKRSPILSFVPEIVNHHKGPGKLIRKKFNSYVSISSWIIIHVIYAKYKRYIDIIIIYNISQSIMNIHTHVVWICTYIYIYRHACKEHNSNDYKQM